MDKVIVRYCNNHSTRYDGKEFLESVSKLRRKENATWSLEIGESVTIKTKSQLWKAVIVNLRPEASSTKKRKAQTSDVNASEPKRNKRKKSSRSDAVQDPDVSVVLASFAAAAPPSQRLGASTSTSHSASAPSTSNLAPSPSPSCHSSPLPLPLSTGYIPPFPTSHSPSAPSTSDHLATALLPSSNCCPKGLYSLNELFLVVRFHCCPHEMFQLVPQILDRVAVRALRGCLEQGNAIVL